MSFSLFRSKGVVLSAILLVFLFLFNASYTPASAAQEKTASDLKKEGIELYHSGSYVQAIGILKQVESKTQDKYILAQAYLYLAMSYFGLEEKEESAKWLNKALETTPNINEADLLFPPGFDTMYLKAKDAVAAKQVQVRPSAPEVKRPVVKPASVTGEKKKKKSPLLLIVGGLAAAGGLTIALMGKKTPKATTGSIQITSTPTGAKVYLDDADTGRTTNCTLSNINAGSHTIKLIKDGYEDTSGIANVTAGQTANVTLPLTANTITIILPTASTIWTKGSPAEIKWQIGSTGSTRTQSVFSSPAGPTALAQHLLARHLPASYAQGDSGQRFSDRRSSANLARTRERTARKERSRDSAAAIVKPGSAIAQDQPDSQAGAPSSPILSGSQSKPGSLKYLSTASSLDIVKVKIDLYNGTTLVTPPIASEVVSTPGTFTWTVSQDLASGTNYKVRVSCTTSSEVFKDSPIFTINDVPKPDLIVDSLTHSPASPTTSDTITVTAVVKNTGAIASGTSVLSLDAGGSISTHDITPLAAGAIQTVTTTRGPLAAGNWTFTAMADSANTVAESSEANNVRTDTCTVLAMPDLVVDSLTHGPSSPTILDPIAVAVVVKNIGTAEAGASTLSLAAGGSTTTHIIGALAPGATQTVTRTVGPLAAGSYTFTATADSANAVTESDESNNVKTDSITVTAPDLTVSGSHRIMGSPGNWGVVITAVVRNQGNIQAGASKVRIQYTGTGGTQSTDVDVPALAPGEEYSAVTGFNIWQSGGTHTVVLTADVNGAVAESNENNNSIQFTFTF